MKKNVNKGQLIYEHLKSQIDKNHYQPGELLPTDMDLCAQFNASRPTVAKSIQKLVNEGLLSRKAGYGTYLNESQHISTSTPQYTFGLLIPSLGETEIFEPICGQIAQMADQYHFNLLWGGNTNTESKSKTILQLAQKYVDQKVDGVFFNPLELSQDAIGMNKEIVKLFSANNIPIVLLDGDLSTSLNSSRYDLVSIDNLQAGFEIGKHLLDQGCKNISFFKRPYSANTIHQRWMGCCEALNQHRHIKAHFKTFDVHSSTDSFLETLEIRQYDAIIASNDALAVELMQTLEKGHIKVPEEIKVAGFDDVKYASFLKIPLTTYRQPCKDIGVAAVEAMISRISNPSISPRKILLSGELKIRTSTSGF